MIPDSSVGLAALVLAAIASSLVVAYVLLRIRPENPELVQLVTSILILLGMGSLLFDDVVGIVRGGTGGTELIPAIAAVALLAIATWFVGHSATQAMG